MAWNRETVIWLLHGRSLSMAPAGEMFEAVENLVQDRFRAADGRGWREVLDEASDLEERDLARRYELQTDLSQVRSIVRVAAG